jgi:hypothetical protein
MIIGKKRKVNYFDAHSNSLDMNSNKTLMHICNLIVLLNEHANEKIYCDITQTFIGNDK